MLVMTLFTITSCSTNEKLPPLIDRELFFEDPEISSAQISPDGAYLAFLRPYLGTRNIWVKPIDAPFEEALPVSADTLRPIFGYMWSRDGKFILYGQDKGGDENFNIYAIDPTQAKHGVIPEARNVTNMQGVRASLVHVSRIDPDLIFVG